MIEDPNLPVICRSCGRTVAVKNIHFDESNKQYICTTCFNASKNSREIKAMPKEEKTEEPKASSGDKINYQCAHCKYKFSRPKEKVPHNCPYCGNKVLEMTDDSAEKLLYEADEWT